MTDTTTITVERLAATHDTPGLHPDTLTNVTAATLRALAAERDRMREALDDANISVRAFGAPYAVEYAKKMGLPDGHIFAMHYDILKEAGARMDDFTRYERAALDKSNA